MLRPGLGAGGDSGATELPITKEIDSTTPSFPVLAGLLSASPGPFQVEQDQSIPAAGTWLKEGQVPALEDIPSGKPAKDIIRALSPGTKPQYKPSLHYNPRSSVPRLEEVQDRESTPRFDSAGEGGGDSAGGTEPPQVQPIPGRRLSYGFCSSGMPSVHSGHDNEAEAVQQPDNAGNPRYHLRRRRHGGVAVGDYNEFHIPQGSEGE